MQCNSTCTTHPGSLLAKYKRQQLTSEKANQQAATEPLFTAGTSVAQPAQLVGLRHNTGKLKSWNLCESQCHCLQKGNAEVYCKCSPGKVTVRDSFVEGGGGLVGDPNDRAVGGAEALPRPVLGLSLHVGSDALHLRWGSCRTASLTFTKQNQNVTSLTAFQKYASIPL